MGLVQQKEVVVAFRRKFPPIDVIFKPPNGGVANIRRHFVYHHNIMLALKIVEQL